MSPDLAVLTYWKRHTLKQIATITNNTYNNLFNSAKRLGIKPLSSAEIILYKLYTEYKGKTIEEIAKLESVSDKRIKTIAEANGIQLCSEKKKYNIKAVNDDQAGKPKSISIAEHQRQQEERRKNFKHPPAVYTQSGTDSLDQYKGIKTTIRVSSPDLKL